MEDLFGSVEGGDVPQPEKLLHLPLEPNLTDVYGRVPLHLASIGGHLEAARLLLEAGANPNFLFEARFTALQLASFAGHAEVVQTLLDSGADASIAVRSTMNPLVCMPWRPC